jgi:IS5 family transposase
MSQIDDFFRSGIDQMIDLRHPLAALASHVTWQQMTVVVDTTVQEKAIAHPTDSRLLEVARQKLPNIAKNFDLSLRQTVVKEDKRLSHPAGRYAHARQLNRMRKAR